MTSRATSAASKALNTSRNWRTAIIALSAVVALVIGATVYFGAVVLPQQNKKANLAACKIFKDGYQAAQQAAIDEANAKDHVPDQNVAIANYVNTLMHANNAAFSAAAKDGDVQKSFTAMAMQIMRYRATVTATPQFPTDIDTGAHDIITACQSLK